MVCADSAVQVATLQETGDDELQQTLKGICHIPHSMLVAAFVAVVFGSMLFPFKTCV